jgi:hypothetical protein
MIHVVKLYFIALTGLFAYAAFVQTKIISSTSIANNFVLFSVFGVLYTIVVFMIGWALMSHLSHVLSGISIAYKHIGQMRYLKSLVFPDNIFAAKSIMPMMYNEVPVTYSKDLPLIFSVTNYLVLLISFYYLSMSCNWFIAYNATTTVLMIVATTYPSSYLNFYKKISCARLVTPEKNELVTKIQLDELLQNAKNESSYAGKKAELKALGILFVFVKLVLLALFFLVMDAYKYVIAIEMIIIVLFIYLQYRIGIHLMKAIPG